jgi:large subunit ribosomal protein L4e
VYKSDNAKEIADSVATPAVFTAPIRNDLVHFVHSNLAKNRRQGHAVFHKAGAEHSAESWGTGRAVARIPRISGSGTSRAGQATFGNMCRKARMFAPLKIWRKWHQSCNVTQRRHAVASALAASACPPLVLARGHRVEGVPELPMVIRNNDTNTKSLLSTLNKLGAGDDLAKVRKSKQIRQGTGKYRNSRYVMRKGPLLVYGDASKHIKQSARNLPGVDTCHVHRLNVLQLAPGGHLGRFTIFTEDAFKALNDVFGTHAKNSTTKSGYHLNRPVMDNADIARIINSDQVQSKLRATRVNVRLHDKQKKNPLKNKALMTKLNPFAKKAATLKITKKASKQKRKDNNAKKHKRDKTYKSLQTGLEASFKHAEDIIEEEDRQGNYVPGETDEEDDE